jgi:DNA-binding transcriptional ArsR family regulator
MAGAESGAGQVSGAEGSGAGQVSGAEGSGAGPVSGAEGSGAGEVFAALSDPTRREVLELIGARGEASASELARSLPVSRQAIGKHLTSLAAAGLVADRRDGREVLYRLTPAPMSEAMGWMAAVGGRWDERLAALGRHLASRSRAAG